MPQGLQVEYARTPLGRGMLEPLAAACAWAAEHWDELLDAREACKSRRATEPNRGEAETPARATGAGLYW